MYCVQCTYMNGGMIVCLFLLVLVYYNNSMSRRYLQRHILKVWACQTWKLTFYRNRIVNNENLDFLHLKHFMVDLAESLWGLLKGYFVM